MGLLGSVAASGVLAGCNDKKTDAPKPDPATATADTAAASARLAPRHPGGRNPFNRPDPAVTKEYRVDVCYYGTLSLRQARDAYLASLGKDEPSAKKIPSFGVAKPADAAGAAPAVPLAKPPAPAATAAPGAPPKPLSPAASGSPAATAPASPPGADRARDIVTRMPHERNARSCSSAVPIKDSPMGDVDAQVALFAPFAMDLARDITQAQQYYAREEYTKDSFAKGKELDKKLRESFAKLDEMSDKLGAALEAWHKGHPPDTSKMDEGEKVSLGVLDDGEALLSLIAHKKVDAESWKAAIDKLDKSSAALKAFADGHAADVWSRIMTAPTETFERNVKAAKITPDHSVDLDSYLQIVVSFTSLLDSKQRAIARSVRTGEGAAAAPGAAPAPPAPPTPPPAAPPK